MSSRRGAIRVSSRSTVFPCGRRSARVTHSKTHELVALRDTCGSIATGASNCLGAQATCETEICVANLRHSARHGG